MKRRKTRLGSVTHEDEDEREFHDVGVQMLRLDQKKGPVQQKIGFPSGRLRDRGVINQNDPFNVGGCFINEKERYEL